MEKATFGAGCFWGVEEVFRTTPGVLKTTVGYEGGHTQNPTYEDVCTDETGYAEVVQVEFDPSQVTYEQLLELFWNNHNPTELNRQGPDEGSQYRSVVFFHSPEQRMVAEKSLKALVDSKKFKRPVVTQIVVAEIFYPAEDYHQQYLFKRGKSHCHV